MKAMLSSRRGHYPAGIGILLVIVVLIAGIVGCAAAPMFDIDPNSGELLETIILTSSDEMLTVTIPEGTIALDEDGNPLLTLAVNNDPEPPAPPEDVHIIGLAYDLGPAGATFDPAVTLTWEYGSTDVPDGVDEEDLVIAYYDGETGKWVVLESVVDTAANTIEASVSHLTTFATLGVPPVQYGLTTSSSAGGNVTTPGEGVFTYDDGTVVDLVAEPHEGYQFVNWAGNVGTIVDVNAATTTINMTGNYSITANFEEIPPFQYTLTISSTAGGSVTAPGEGAFTYNASTVVNLAANPLSGYYFVSWTGNVSTVADVGVASTTIVVNDDYSITANFDEIPVTYYTLTVAVSGNGSTGPSVGQHTYAVGTVVSITANPDSRYHFVNWTGNVAAVGNVNAASTTVTMNDNYSITANFEEEVVTFSDANLEAAIREAIGKPTGDIHCSDLEGLTYFEANNSNIAQLTGLEHCTNLIHLALPGNQISSLSPLSDLTSLTVLCIASNQISDISPLANLTSLTGLCFDHNQISDVSPLANLINLDWLELSANQVSDISPLANLTNLTGLLLEHNQISDISALANLTALTRVQLWENQINDISALSNLTNVPVLGLGVNQIDDISPLASLTNLTSLGLQYNQVDDISPLANLTNLTALGLDFNQITDISPLANLSNLAQLNLRANQIENIYPLVQNVGLDTGDTVNLESNPLSCDSVNICIPELEARGVTVFFGEQAVYFADPNLEAAVREAIGKSTGCILRSDLEGLTSLDASHRSIVDPTGLEYCIDLTHLDLGANQIANLSPLANLTSLTWLDLAFNQIGNVLPLVNLTNLQDLDLSHNQIGDISAVGNLINLTLLGLGHNQISDISAVANLTNLTRMSLRNNQISDVSPLANLTSMTWLASQWNDISDIAPLANLINLQDLDLAHNQIIDISPLASLTSLRWITVRDNQISDISSLASLTNLTWLSLYSNQISDISVLANLTNLNHISLRYNQVSNISPLVANAGLGVGDAVYLEGNPLSSDSINIYIPELEARGVYVEY